MRASPLPSATRESGFVSYPHIKTRPFYMRATPLPSTPAKSGFWMIYKISRYKKGQRFSRCPYRLLFICIFAVEGGNIIRVLFRAVVLLDFARLARLFNAPFLLFGKFGRHFYKHAKIQIPRTVTRF